MPELKRSVISATTATPELTNHSQNEWLRSSNDNNGRHRIHPVTEGVQSAQTADVYKRYLNHFLDHIKIHDLQVLLDFSPKVIKQMLVDYILYLKDEKHTECSGVAPVESGTATCQCRCHPPGT